MASVHRDPRGRSRYWYASFRTVDGKQHFRSTKKTRKSDAQEVAVTWEQAYRRLKNGDRMLEILNVMRRSLGDEEFKQVTVRNWVNQWLEIKKRDVKASTLSRYRSSLAKLLSCLEKAADAPLSRLRAEAIDAFITHELEEGLAPKTINLDLKAISQMCKDAKSRGHLLENPVDHIHSLPNEAARKQAFSLEQLQKILAVAAEAPEGAEWKGMIRVGYYTGLRLGDLKSLTWEAIDLKGAAIALNPTKRGRRDEREELRIPVHPDLLQWLRDWRKRQPSPPGKKDALFPKLSTRPLNQRNGLSDTFGLFITKAGIENTVLREPAKGDRGRKVMAYGFHSLRRTFNTELAKAQVDERMRMLLSDHQSPEVNKRYVEGDVQFSQLADANRKLPPI